VSTIGRASGGRAVVSGMICSQPNQGGATWAVLQFVLGLRRLGWEVYFVELIDPAAVQPAGAKLDLSVNAAYLAATMSGFGLEQRWSLLSRGTRESVGLSRSRIDELCRDADMVLDISGTLAGGDLLDGTATNVYVDLDPAFTQLWQEVEGIDMHLAGHDRFVTVGMAIGQPGCAVPTCGREWITIPPPVVLEEWPAADAPTRSEMTTVGHWRGYGSIDHGGVLYGQRAHSLRRLMQLPSLTDQPLLLALAIHPDERADIAALATSGWRLVEPATVAASPEDYRSFVRESRAELGVPKSGYVESACGWFSDRSACYLASGRPVVVQETGFSDYLPSGTGLLAYSDAAGAAQCIARVNADYPAHSAAARRIAEQHLDSDLVLGRMVDLVGGGA
jgi:hypothetical protein